MRAVISDIHGNLEAFRAVLADIDRHEAEDIYCLGDVVGYGPDPRECLDLVMGRCNLVLMGNHDQAAVLDAVGYTFNTTAQRAILWTRARLAEPIPDRDVADRRLAFLGDRPSRHREGDLLFVHGSPCNPINEYVFPVDIYDGEMMDRQFEEVESCCFQGHTHIPGVFTDRLADGLHHFIRPDETSYRHRLVAKCLVNVGSVGQPRDGDCRACYALIDGDAVLFRRVEYDIETTLRKIASFPDLAGSLATRLKSASSTSAAWASPATVTAGPATP